ncbi:MAG: hypothetical protein ACR2IJ_11395 [Fluviibacter sp.]
MQYQTDVNNPDSRLNVKFYQRAISNEFKSALEGRPIMEMADFVLIEVPGDNLTVIDTFAVDEHKKRFPIQWARYQNEKTDGDIEGTLLHDWPVLNAASAAELKHFRFYTVEQIAQASDAQLNTLGMAAGMSPLALRDKAKAYLGSAKDTALVQQQADELSKRDEIIARMEAQIAELAQQANKPKAMPKKAKAEETIEE